MKAAFCIILVGLLLIVSPFSIKNCLESPGYAKRGFYNNDRVQLSKKDLGGGSVYRKRWSTNDQMELERFKEKYVELLLMLQELGSKISELEKQKPLETQDKSMQQSNGISSDKLETEKESTEMVYNTVTETDTDNINISEEIIDASSEFNTSLTTFSDL
ncbi:hypothetical protein BB560_002390 [Smittium megazygosporum]|uniref:Uncharacterized protein n=1 Tax=Smittium megazygosporum TaxID=133381 RepID=A0A2T9ZEZ4_9FUNG|nr:hypothetical protein BB560_002390 [Smittium megazygosporum]